jgi:hypothetical protein
MVGAVDRDEGLGVPCRVEDPLSILHTHRLVGRRVQHQERVTQPVNTLRLRLRGDVVEELPTDAEHTAPQIHLGLPAPLDLLPPAAEGVRDMSRVHRGTDRGHRRDLGYPVSGGQHRCAAQGMPDEDRRCREVFAQMVRGTHEIVHIGAERTVGEVAPGLTEAGEIHTEDRDSAFGQLPGDPSGRQPVLATREAGGEYGVRPRRPLRQIQARHQRNAPRTGEFDFPTVPGHLSIPRPNLNIVAYNPPMIHRPVIAAWRSGRIGCLEPLNLSRSAVREDSCQVCVQVEMKALAAR